MNEAAEQNKSANCGEEIDAAAVSLNAELSDLENLMVPILRKGIPLRQVPGLLEHAHIHLQALRQDLSGLKSKISAERESAGLAGLLRRVESMIRSGDSFSFENALQTLEEANDICSGRADLIVNTAMIHSMQASIHSAAHNYRRAAQCYGAAAGVPGLSIERQWYYQKQKASALFDLGREFGNHSALEDSVSLLRTTVLDLASAEQDSGRRATTLDIIGTVQGVLGQRRGGTRNLENAISSFRASLLKRDRRKDPLQWAQTENGLGNALGALGHRRGDDKMLAEAITAFELALEERTPDRAGRDRAATLNNLATVMQSLGQRKKDAKMLKKSVELYKEALQIRTRERGPYNWAAIMDNLGTALRLLGEHRKGPKTLQQSVAAYNSALSIRTRARLPREWAMTQNNLGTALHKLGERQGHAEIFERAVTAYENALTEWSRETMPMTWGMTAANLGVARKALAELSGDMDTAEKAVRELEAVCDFFRNASHARYSELSIDQLAKARKLVDALHASSGKYADLVRR